MSETLLALHGVQKSFGSVQALSGVDIDIARGEVHALCGENGAGKSTLLKILSGVYAHGSYTGRIELDGAEARFSGIQDSEASGIGIIHQELTLCPNLSIAENIFLGHEISRGGIIDWHDVNLRAAGMLAQVGLDENPSALVGALGVGKQQLIEIAKALSRDTRILLLDEPTAALNDTDAEHLLDIVRSLRDGGTTCVIITHKLGEIRAIADRVTVLRDGRSIETLSMSDPEATDDRIIRDMVGRDIDEMYPERERAIGSERLRIADWTVDHPTDRERRMIDRASLNVRAGEIVGLAGLVGSGRTELAMSVFGRSYGRWVGGILEKDGRRVVLPSVKAAIENGLAYVSEDRKSAGLNLISSIAVNISAANLAGVSRRGVVDPHREVLLAERFRESLRIRTQSVLEPVGNLSGGNQQKVSLSKWINTDADVLILDEPTRGVDVGAKSEIYQIIGDLASEGKAVLVISSELPELLGLCDRIYTLCEGRITADIDAGNATQEELMRHMTLDRPSESATPMKGEPHVV